MCAKVSGKSVRAVGTPQSVSSNRNTRHTPSKTPLKLASENPNRTSSAHSRSDSEPYDQSDSDSGDDEDDFLGRPPSNELSVTNGPRSEQSLPQRTSKGQRPNDTQQKSRKQAKPKKRKDIVTRDIVKLQKTTDLLIPRLPFQRYVLKSKKKKSKCRYTENKEMF